MLNIEELLKSYPKKQHVFKRSILREYIQYKVLDIIYNSDYANKLLFMGGTALRIVYANQRFSEDLDFDNRGLTEKEFLEFSLFIKKKLELDGFKIEIKIVYKNAFRIYLKIPQILYDEGLSDMQEEKLTIQIDTTPQEFSYERESRLIDKFDIYTHVSIVPIDIIMSQKLFAIFNRKRIKGRDFFDVDFLSNNLGVQPNYDYLDKKININNKSELTTRLKTHLSSTNFKTLSNDVRPFLINHNEIKRVENFYKNIEKYNF